MTINIVKLHAAAFYFAYHSRHVREISEHVGVVERTIKRWAALPEWESALDALGYTGARDFVYHQKRDVAREQGEVYARAKSVYVGFLRDGTPAHKLVSMTSLVVNLPVGMIRRWAKNGNWKGEVE